MNEKERLDDFLFFLETQQKQLSSAIEGDKKNQNLIGQYITDAYANTPKNQQKNYQSLSKQLDELLQKHKSSREAQLKIVEEMKNNIESVRLLIEKLKKK